MTKEISNSQIDEMYITLKSFGSIGGKIIGAGGGGFFLMVVTENKESFKREALKNNFKLSILLSTSCSIMKRVSTIHNFNFHRITAVTSSQNIRSINALKKVGFKEEGVFRDNMLYADGNRDDLTSLALLVHEYRHNKLLK